MHDDPAGKQGLATAQGQAPAADTGGPGQLDAQAIAKLRELDPDGRHDVLGRVLRAYEASLARLLDELQPALAQGAMDRLLRSAHTLKSSSASVGAARLSRMCAELERMVRNAPTVSPGPQVEALIHEGTAVLAAVRAMLPRQA